MKQIKLTTATVSTRPTLLGACMEDVNHELYGGIWAVTGILEVPKKEG